MADLFNFLETMSPWWWVAFGIGLAAVEMATMSFYLIWPALAGIVMAVMVALFPTMPGEVQVAVFAALSVALTFAGRSMLHRFGDGGGGATALNRRSGQMVGRSARVVAFSRGEGTVEIDGVPWRALSQPVDAVIVEGAQVRVVGAEGMVLRVARDSA
jgi:membrane protein implicated in regulation of membrane protease activity